MKPQDTALLRALRHPADVPGWSEADCSALLHQARASGLLGRVAVRVGLAAQAAGLGAPPPLRGHFESALRLCRAQRAEVEREARFLRAALQDLGAPAVMLKGAAYVLAGLPAADGRLFSDIDLLVPKARLAQAESLLLLHGWMGQARTDYDERYYREWMHELPPMTHVHRQTTLDLHHTLLPETARLHPDAVALVAAAQPIAGWPGLHMLCPADMVLHSMTHLFLNDETRHALRDLCDLDALLRHFGSAPLADPADPADRAAPATPPTPTDPDRAAAGKASAPTGTDFWQQLLQRARLHQLTRPLYYGLRYTQLLLGTPVPDGLQQELRAAAPAAGLRLLMDALWLRALHPGGTRPLPGQALALGALYVRGHWLRMPAPLLLRHLGTKALRLHEKPLASAAPPAV